MKSKPFKHKTIVICSILSVITLFSIGFASWIVNNKYVESNIKIEIGKINNFNQFEFGDITTFTFNKYGVLEDDIYQSKGNIQISFLIKLKNGLAQQQYDRDKLSLEFLWESANQSINLNDYFSSNEEENIKCYYSYNSYDDALNNNTSFLLDFSKQDRTIASTINTEISVDDFSKYNNAYFVINFNYDFSAAYETFETTIYDKLITDNGIFFKFSLGVIN